MDAATLYAHIRSVVSFRGTTDSDKVAEIKKVLDRYRDEDADLIVKKVFGGD